jgi:drug/metabolite transporter (DMT)-like permease
MDSKFGVFLKIMSTLSATLMLACVKGLHGFIPTGEVIFFRSFFALLPLVIWLKFQGDFFKQIKTRNVGGHIIRGFSGTGGMFFNYLALVYLSLADVTAISYAAPLFTVVMAALMLKEKVFFTRWLSIIVGFSGILLMLSGKLSLGQNISFENIQNNKTLIGATFAIIAAACAATSNIQIRFLNGREAPGAIVFWFSIMTTVIGLMTVISWHMPDAWQLCLLIGCGLFGGTAQILVTLSLRYADASLLAPFDYTTLVWSMIIGYAFLNSMPDHNTLVGASVVALAGIFNIVTNQRKQKSLKAMKSTECAK